MVSSLKEKDAKQKKQIQEMRTLLRKFYTRIKSEKASKHMNSDSEEDSGIMKQLGIESINSSMHEAFSKRSPRSAENQLSIISRPRHTTLSQRNSILQSPSTPFEKSIFARIDDSQASQDLSSPQKVTNPTSTNMRGRSSSNVTTLNHNSPQKKINLNEENNDKIMEDKEFATGDSPGTENRQLMAGRTLIKKPTLLTESQHPTLMTLDNNECRLENLLYFFINNFL